MAVRVHRMAAVALTAAALGGAGLGWSGLASAQSASQPAAPAAAPAVAPAADTTPPPPRMHDMGMGMRGPGMAPGMMMGMHRPGMPMMAGHGWMHDRHPFGLIYTAQDRKLSPADVQTIVQGFLLFHGNHSWKVANVQAQGEDVAFSLTTPDGSVIASFTMDAHDGRVSRTG